MHMCMLLVKIISNKNKRKEIRFSIVSIILFLYINTFHDKIRLVVSTKKESSIILENKFVCGVYNRLITKNLSSIPFIRLPSISLGLRESMCVLKKKYFSLFFLSDKYQITDYNSNSSRTRELSACKLDETISSKIMSFSNANIS
jgi:hypothetical protein